MLVRVIQLKVRCSDHLFLAYAAPDDQGGYDNFHATVGRSISILGFEIRKTVDEFTGVAVLALVRR